MSDKPPSRRRRVLLSVPPPLYARIEAHAESHGLPIASVALEAVALRYPDPARKGGGP